MKPKVYKNRYYDGVNFDYVLAVKYDENNIEKHKIPIQKNEGLIEELIRMVDEDIYEVDDIYYKFRRQYCDYGDYEYCLGFPSLKAYYIDPISYPYFDEIKYRKQAQEFKDRISSAKTEAAREWKQKDFNKWNHRQKEDYINKCLPYVFARNYHNAMEGYDIEKDYFIYSNESHGRFTYSRKITEDLEILLKTNFCYGDSSRFFVIITYKGIPILPYSVWVRYYYAGFNEIVRYTRSYDCSRRAHWNNCMDFVVWFVRKAIERPDEFVREIMLEEVKELMKGVEGVYNISDEEMKKFLEFAFADITEGENYYIGIRKARMATQKEIDYFKIAPKEAKLVFRMEKITGALHFLKSLRKLSEIYDEVEQAINRIKEINKLFYPEIANAIPPVKEHIAELNETLIPIEKKLNNVQKRFDYLDDRLRKRLEKVSFDKMDEAKESFIKKNPQYEKLRDELSELESRVCTLKTIISNREHYLHQLEDAQLLVRSHVVLES